MLSKINRDGEQLHGLVGAYEMYDNKFQNSNYFYFVDTEKAMFLNRSKPSNAIIAAITYKITNGYIQTQTAGILDALRGTGVMSKLYIGIKDSTGKDIMSDMKQSPGGKNIWDEINQNDGVEVKVYDTETSQKVDNMPLESAYGNTRYLLVTESDFSQASFLSF